ncbi:MAG: ribosome assembly cofactor RimP [Cyanobium sp.]
MNAALAFLASGTTPILDPATPAADPRLAHPLILPITALARRVAGSAGLSVKPAWLSVKEVHLLTHHIPMTVQVMVERTDGGDVTLEDCAALSAPLGEALEEAGLLESAYVLEVSSPGLGDLLETDRDFSSFRGFPVDVRLRPEGAAGTTSRSGLLLERTEEAIAINVRGRTLRLPRDAVIEVRLSASEDA